MTIKYSILICSIFMCSMALVSCKNETDSIAQPKNVNVAPDKLQSLKITLDSLTNEPYFNGIGVAIVSDKGILFEKGYGKRNLTTNDPYTIHTTQQTGSIAKIILGLALAKAVEDGNLKLDDPVNKYLPFKLYAPAYEEAVITVKQIATHTSSLQDGADYRKTYLNLEQKSTDKSIDSTQIQLFQNPETNKNLEAYLRDVIKPDNAFLVDYSFGPFSPGVAHKYTNTGGAVLALILEKATKMTYKDYVQKNIIGPLGLKETGWDIQKTNPNNSSKNYMASGKRYPDYGFISYPENGLVSSTHDLAILTYELLQGFQGKGKLLSKDSYELFYKKQLTIDNFMDPTGKAIFEKGFNKGLMITYEPQHGIGHTSANPGSSSSLFILPESKTGLVFIINTDIATEESFKNFLGILKTLEVNAPKIAQ